VASGGKLCEKREFCNLRASSEISEIPGEVHEKSA